MLINTSIIASFIIYFSSCAVLAQAQYGSRIDCGRIDNPEINEASGIAASKVNNGILWTHNDSGDKNRIFAIDTKGRNLCEYYFKDCKFRDVEDIAVGPGPEENASYIYVGDIGDNKAKHNKKYIYRCKEPVISDKNSNVKDIDILKFTYPDGNKDAEALMVDPLTKDYYVISKREFRVRVYKAKYPQPVSKIDTLQCVDTLDLAFIVAADISPSGDEIIMKNYGEVFFWKRLPGEAIQSALKRAPTKLPYIKEPQGEGICWDSKGRGYYTISEIVDNQPCHLYYYPRLN